MCLTDLTWNDIDATTIHNCWHKADILSSMKESSPLESTNSSTHDSGHQSTTAQAEKEIEAVLDNLVLTGVLQAPNRLDIENLINPEEKS